jgi:hypothetical protein
MYFVHAGVRATGWMDAVAGWLALTSLMHQVKRGRPGRGYLDQAIRAADARSNDRRLPGEVRAFFGS